MASTHILRHPAWLILASAGWFLIAFVVSAGLMIGEDQGLARPVVVLGLMALTLFYGGKALIACRSFWVLVATLELIAALWFTVWMLLLALR